MALGFTSFGHWLASVGSKILQFEKKVKPVADLVVADLAKVAGSEGTVEALTSLFGAPAAAVNAEKVVFGSFGVLHDAITSAGNAADAGGLSVTLDAQTKADILAVGKYFATHPMAGPALNVPATPQPAPGA
jgi:hypothetical protein